MCGIVGYVGKGLAIPQILDSLKRLEYRGYDSSGIAFLEGNNLYRERKIGKIVELEKSLKNKLIASSCAIGHTRWATHGVPNIYNSHPHIDMLNCVAVVHNGIIENYQELREELMSKGVIFSSQTDTEVIPQLLSYLLRGKSLNRNNILIAIQQMYGKLQGSFALAILIKGYNGVFAIKRGSPLVVGAGKDANYLASDIPAILPFTNKILHILDLQIVVLQQDKILLFDKNLKQCKKIFRTVSMSIDTMMIGSADCFMEKEIESGARAVIDTIERLQKFKIISQINKKRFANSFTLHIVACGTALHAGRIAKYLFEKHLRILVDLDFASEFRYKEPLLDSKSICIFISQSGETADTLACLDLAKSKGAYCIGITNVESSKMAQEVDLNISTSAGVEMAVASTKAYLAQLGAIYYLVLEFANLLNQKIDIDLNGIMELVKQNESKTYITEWKQIVPYLSREKSILFIGRGMDYFLAMEGALKVKEITYIHCEAIPAGELKHGSLALISPLSIVIVILTQELLIEKTINAIHEMQSRGAKVILITDQKVDIVCEKVVNVPFCVDDYSPFVTIRSLQELAYLLAKEKNIDPDKPRNLAKSVTVE